MGNCLTSMESSGSDQTNPVKAEEPSDDTSNYIPAHYSGDVDDFQLTRYKDVEIFTYNEMKAATMNFKPDQILGEGGFGSVYKGVIDENVKPGYKSTEVAIKELNPEGFQGNREWQAEVNYLGQLSHPNLVKLIGYCCEDEHRLLVYEYMAYGSLEEHLFRRVSETMPWSTRMMIALGAAKGLAFLHESKRPIIYRDFKTSNILLDSNYNAKLSDFGLAKDGPMGDQTHVSTRVMGTYGYAAPEYVMTGHLTARSDVYGFGVVLLEMLAGRRALDKSRPSREHNLVEWARPYLIHRKKVLKMIMDPRMQGQYTAKSAQKIAQFAHQCLSRNPKGRPIMSNVVEILMNFQTHSPLPNGGVTLFEAPKSPPGKINDEVRHLPVKSSDRKGNAPRSRRTRRELGRSKSETHIEVDLQRLSPDSRTADFEQWKKRELPRDF